MPPDDGRLGYAVEDRSIVRTPCVFLTLYERVAYTKKFDTCRGSGQTAANVLQEDAAASK